MIDIRILATGSAGNAYILQNGAGALLIEAGISFRKIVRAIDYDLSRLDRVLISHEHADHSMAARQLVRIGAPVSMSAGTAAALDLDANLIDIVKSERQYDFGHWNILPFTTEHDAAEPLGFLISDNQGEKICYITDSAYVRYRFEGVTRWIVEANYCERMIDANAHLPEKIKQRIRRNHFEIENLKEFFKNQDLSKTREVFLIHLSDENSDEALFVDQIEKIVGKPVYYLPFANFRTFN